MGESLGYDMGLYDDPLDRYGHLSEESLRNEITRYITWPGQATAYKVGQLKIQELRDRATEALGEKFTLKDFHEIVLQSVGPLYILEEQVDLYIASGGQI